MIYSTSEIAARVGIHPNTVRFYEQIGFITPPERLANGYRVFTELQLAECELVRTAMKAEVLCGGMRKKAVETVRFVAARDFENGLKCADEYRTMIISEMKSAREAAASVKAIIKGKPEMRDENLRRREAARETGVTSDALRNWELNGLLRVKRLENGYRVYNGEDVRRLKIIRTLRCAGYSLSAILRLMLKLDGDVSGNVVTILDTPGCDDDIISVCDRLSASLEGALADSEEMISRIKEIIEKF